MFYNDHRSTKPTCCEHCPRRQETNFPECCTLIYSDKELPKSVAEKSPKPSSKDKVRKKSKKEIVGDNPKDKVSHSRRNADSRKNKFCYQNLGRILCCKVGNKKKIKKTTKDHSVIDEKKSNSKKSANTEKV